MGIFDSTKKTVNTTTNEYNQYSDASNTAAQSSSGSAVSLRGDSNNISILDDGAIAAGMSMGQSALGLGKSSLDFAGSATSDVLKFASGSSAASFDFAQHVSDKAQQNIMEGTTAVLNKVTTDSGERVQQVVDAFGKYGMLIAGIAVAVVIFKK
jgi:hypothetical protein